MSTTKETVQSDKLASANGNEKPKGKRGLKALQQELVKVKEKFKENVKILTSKRNLNKNQGPWPIIIQKTSLPNKDAQNYDVSNIVVKLVIDSKFDPKFPTRIPVHVEAPPHSELPNVLQNEICKTIEERWISQLLEKGNDNGWLLLDILGWIDQNYLKLLRLKPELIEHYIEGTDADGSSQRRFTIITPSQIVQNDGCEGEGVDEEEARRAAEYYAQKELERLEEENEQDRKKKEAGARIRALYEEGKLQAPPPKLSKKELEEKRKSKQGVRMAKRPPKAKPYEGEGAKERRKGKPKNV